MLKKITKNPEVNYLIFHIFAGHGWHVAGHGAGLGTLASHVSEAENILQLASVCHILCFVKHYAIQLWYMRIP